MVFSRWAIITMVLARVRATDRRLKFRFILRVHTGGGFIQDNDGSVFENRPCNEAALPFPPGERAAAFTQHRIIAVGQHGDKVVAAGPLCGFHYLRMGGARAAHEDVFPHRAVEEVIVRGT